jgi:hypothetical protein
MVPHSVRVTRCRSCNAEIFWGVIGQDGRKIPVDATATEDGNLSVDWPRDPEFPPRVEALGVGVARARRAAGESLYRTHFATCPNAAKHRKR